MKTVWLVRGQCGQYDDFTDWVAAVFATEDEADKFRAAAQICAQQNEAILHEKVKKNEPWWDNEPQSPYDPFAMFRISEPTVYVLEEIPFYDEFVPVVQQDRAQSSEG